jgi:hypothetical protein
VLDTFRLAAGFIAVNEKPQALSKSKPYEKCDDINAARSRKYRLDGRGCAILEEIVYVANRLLSICIVGLGGILTYSRCQTYQRLTFLTYRGSLSSNSSI